MKVWNQLRKTVSSVQREWKVFKEEWRVMEASTQPMDDPDMPLPPHQTWDRDRIRWILNTDRVYQRGFLDLVWLSWADPEEYDRRVKREKEFVEFLLKQQEEQLREEKYGKTTPVNTKRLYSKFHRQTSRQNFYKTMKTIVANREEIKDAAADRISVLNDAVGGFVDEYKKSRDLGRVEMMASEKSLTEELKEGVMGARETVTNVDVAKVTNQVHETATKSAAEVQDALSEIQGGVREVLGEDSARRLDAIGKEAKDKLKDRLGITADDDVIAKKTKEGFQESMKSISDTAAEVSDTAGKVKSAVQKSGVLGDIQDKFSDIFGTPRAKRVDEPKETKPVVIIRRNRPPIIRRQ
jgi:flavin-binding protein dodecin